MAVDSINPFALGNIGRSFGASTYTPPSVTSTKPVDNSNKSGGFKGFASTDDMEKALQFAQGNISSKVNKSAQTRPIDKRGSAWDGFKVPSNNGTGELIPQYGEGERVLDFSI